MILNLSMKEGTINSFYNHTCFCHIFVCVTFIYLFLLVTIYFSKKLHSLKSLSHSLITQNICNFFFINVIIMGKSKAILGFCKL